MAKKSGVVEKLTALSGELDQEVNLRVLRIFQEIVTETPVDTGSARSNWRIVETPTDATYPAFTKLKEGGKGEQQNLQAAIAKAYKDIPNQWKLIYIENNLPHIELLEVLGHSKQAPAGFVRAIVDKYRG